MPTWPLSRSSFFRCEPTEWAMHAALAEWVQGERVTLSSFQTLIPLHIQADRFSQAPYVWPHKEKTETLGKTIRKWVWLFNLNPAAFLALVQPHAPNQTFFLLTDLPPYILQGISYTLRALLPSQSSTYRNWECVTSVNSSWCYSIHLQNIN
jgi:hypothetical protein